MVDIMYCVRTTTVNKGRCNGPLSISILLLPSAHQARQAVWRNPLTPLLEAAGDNTSAAARSHNTVVRYLQRHHTIDNTYTK